MSQGFLFRLDNQTEQSISFSQPSGQDDCIDEFGTIPSPLARKVQTPNIYAQVRTMCNNGMRTIDFNPTGATVANSKGTLQLNFSKEDDTQDPYGTVSLQSYTPATISEDSSKIVQITPSLTRWNDTGDEWAGATITFNLTVVPKTK